jgi:hypothetical protein
MAASLSVENRGHSLEYEQQAPHVVQGEIFSVISTLLRDENTRTSNSRDLDQSRIKYQSRPLAERLRNS